MVERAVHGNRALLESVLDDISRSDMNQHDYSDVQSDTRDILDYKMMYMFGSGKNISQKELERSAVYDIADIMDIDICMRVYTKSELEDNPLFDHRDAQDVTPIVDCNICLFINKIDQVYTWVSFIFRTALTLRREFNTWPDIREYYNFGEGKFEFENVAAAASSIIFHFFQEKGDISQSSLNLLYQSVEIFADCSYRTSHSVVKYFQNRLKMNRRVNESVLDDIDRSVVKCEDIISDRPDALNYNTLFLFNTDCEVEDTSEIELLGEAMGIDLRVEQYTRENFRELLWIEHSRKTDDTFETDHIACIFVNLPDSDYQKAKFLFLLMRVMPNVYNVMCLSAWSFKNKSGNMFRFTIMENHVIDNVYGLLRQNILNAKNNQTMDMMSFHPAIFSYQNICSLLGFETPE